MDQTLPHSAAGADDVVVEVDIWLQEKAKAILGVPHDLHFDVAISFGYPLTGREQSHTPNPNGRKSFDEVVFWERWGG